jgi:uncharacterized delta-60 repeat protein
LKAQLIMKKLNLIRTTILVASVLLQLSALCFRSHAAAGDLDLSFDTGSGVNGLVTALALQSDGKVIIGGYFTTVRGLARARLARINADGSGDSSFTPGPFAGGGYPPNVLRLQSDGKVLVGHEFGITRFNSDGSLDTVFNDNAYYPGGYTEVHSLAIQQDGKVLIGGFIYTYDGANRSYGVARVNTNGSLDSSFNVNLGEYDLVLSVGLQSDGKVLVGGQLNPGGTNNTLVRLNTNGGFDGSFNPSIGATDSVWGIVVQPDNKVLLLGDFAPATGTNRNRILRLNVNGSLDNSFSPSTNGGAITLQPDGKVLLAGRIRLNSNGSVDGSFNPVAVSGGVNSVALQPDGKVVIGGGFTAVNGTNENYMARLNVNGSLDPSFDSGRGGLTGYLGSLAVQADGKIIYGGVRLYPNGALDNTYTNTTPPGGGFGYLGNDVFPGSDYVIATCGGVQSDGKGLVGGYFAGTYVDPNEGGVTHWTQPYLIRFNTNGSRDTNFNEVIGSPDYGAADGGRPMMMVVQPDDKALFTLRGDLKRLNAGGTTDSNFTAVVIPVFAITLKPDGKIFIIGSFASINGTNRGGIAQLNPNGSLDNSFNPGTGANGNVALFVFQPDGKMLIGGSFTTFNATNRNHIARLNANGSLDLSFNPGMGANGNVSSIALQPDGDILIAGDFLTVNGVLRTYVARLYGDSPWPSLNIARSNGSVILSWPVTALNFQLRETTNLALANAWSLVAQPAVTNGPQISVTLPAGVGPKFFRLKSQ